LCFGHADVAVAVADNAVPTTPTSSAHDNVNVNDRRVITI
jgi:hypothetical protein